jgi:hypothetical protein
MGDDRRLQRDDRATLRQRIADLLRHVHHEVLLPLSSSSPVVILTCRHPRTNASTAEGAP